VECHTNNAGYKANCTSCHEHNKAKTDAQHDDEDGYVYNSASCVSCHPNGKKED
jgi:hypothetical protein